MKKFIKLSILLLFSGILLISCRSKLSITKRHYLKGYYFNVNNKNNYPVQTSRSVKKHREVNLLAVKSLAPLTEKAEQTFIAQNTTTRNNQVAGIKRTLPQNIIQKLNYPVYTKIHPDKPARNLFQPKKLSDDNSRNDGLSLLWVVILAILILWAIGLLAGGFGLGAAIHILVIIALVLLILWLLRIL